MADAPALGTLALAAISVLHELNAETGCPDGMDDDLSAAVSRLREMANAALNAPVAPPTALPGAAPDPSATPRLDALLREVDSLAPWQDATGATLVPLAPRLAAIVRVYDQIARAWARSVSGEGTCPLCRKARWGAATRPHHANCPAVVMSYALLRADEIAKGAT